MTSVTATTKPGEQDPIQQYLARIAAVALLTAAEEVALAKRIEAGVFAAELLRTAGPLPGAGLSSRSSRGMVLGHGRT